MFKRTCPECGKDFTSAKKHAEHCSPACRKAFNNRRQARGAIAYDMLMAMRYERNEATKAGLWADMCKTAQYWKMEDDKERAGRRSWGDWKAWLRDRPFLQNLMPILDGTGKSWGTITKPGPFTGLRG